MFTSHDGKYPCYRQPAIITTNQERTHLMVFAEGRFVADCAPSSSKNTSKNSFPNENGGLEMRRSEDNGSTWSSPTTILSGNIDFYTVVWDSITDMIYLMIEISSSVLLLTSNNEGNDWSIPQPLNVFPPPPYTKMIRPAVGHGVQISDELCGTESCSDAGTLLMPFICSDGSNNLQETLVCSNCYACVLKSMSPEVNQTRQWRFGGIAQRFTRESQLVQTKHLMKNISSIYLNGRNLSPNPGHRLYARSDTGSDHFSEFGIDLTLVEPVTESWTGVVGSVARLSSDPSRIVYSGPVNPILRSNLTLKISYDEAYSWTKSRVVFDGLSAYSDIAVIGNGENLALVFENGEKTFADRISVGIIPIAWIENNR